MPPLLRSSVAALLGPLLAACSRPHTGLGGFEGRITMHSVEATGAQTSFTVRVKQDLLRVDMPPSSTKPGDVALGHAVYEHATNRVRLFFDSTREYRDMDLSARIASEDAEPGVPTLTRKGSRETLAGLPCDDWSVKTPDGGHTDVCLAKGLAYLEMFRVHLGPHRTESSLAREYREHSTFPLAMVEYDAEGRERARVEVTSVERASVDDDVFSLPADYVKVDPHFGDPPGHADGRQHSVKGRRP